MKILNFEFQGPFDHNDVFTRNFGCVYALVNPNSKLVDVGQTNKINDRLPNHDRKQCWIRNGCPNRQLYVRVNENEQARLTLETAIRNRYNPTCGVR